MTLSNSLADLAERVKAANAASEMAEVTAIEKALEVGVLLTEAKAACTHGEWLPFLKRSSIGERKAQRLMKVIAGRLNSDTVTLLGGIMPALRFLKLREIAYRQLTEAWDAAADGRTGGDELVPLETALMLMDEMVAMFPEKEAAA